MFLRVPAYPGCPGSKAVKRSLSLLLLLQQDTDRPPTGYAAGPRLGSESAGMM